MKIKKFKTDLVALARIRTSLAKNGIEVSNKDILETAEHLAFKRHCREGKPNNPGWTADEANQIVSVFMRKFGEDEWLTRAWETLADHYSSAPRFFGTLRDAKLSFGRENGKYIINFPVQNETQKKWIEERMLYELQKNLKCITGKEISVAPYVAEEKEIQVPEKPIEIQEPLLPNYVALLEENKGFVAFALKKCDITELMAAIWDRGFDVTIKFRD